MQESRLMEMLAGYAAAHQHPVQANLAAPFFTVVEAFKLLRLRDDLFRRAQQRIAERQSA